MKEIQPQEFLFLFIEDGRQRGWMQWPDLVLCREASDPTLLPQVLFFTLSHMYLLTFAKLNDEY